MKNAEKKREFRAAENAATAERILVNAPPVPARTSFGTRAATYFVLAAATVLAFVGVARNDWIQLDDPTYVTQNIHVVHGLTWDSFLWFLKPSSVHGGNWHPLTSWSHMLDVELFGQSPIGPHLANLALHVLNACLLLRVLAQLTGAWWRCAIVAALFALHPLRVESVAWVAERKDVLSTLFMLLALVAWRRYAMRRTPARYAAVALMLVLGLMAKPMLVTLPFVLVLVDAWPLGRATWSDLARFTPRARALVLEKVPLFAISAASAMLTLHAQRSAGATTTLQQVPFVVRLSNAVLGYVRYLEKSFWPVDLSVYYPYDSGVAPLRPILAALLLAAITAGVVFAWRSRPYLAFGWFWFLGMLVPVIGLVQVGGQSLADRYTYATTIGVGIALVFGIHDLVVRSRVLVVAAAIVTGACLAMLVVRTHDQVALWRNTRTLFGHALEVTEHNGLAHQVYGNALLSGPDTDVDAAMEHLNEALRLVPDFPDAHNNLGSALGVKGRYEEAIVHFKAALRTQPTVEVHHNLGFALAQLKRFDEAIVEYRAALSIEPEHVGARSKLGLALGALGRLDEAARELGRTLELAPDEMDTRRYYALTLGLLKRHDESIAQYEELLGRHAGDDAARGALIEALRARAIELVVQGRIEDGIGRYREILKRDPDDLDALNNIAWIRATHADESHRNAREAIELAEHARDKSAMPVAVLFSTLAAAYAEAARFDDAIQAAEKAIELARASNDMAEAQRFELQREKYRTKQPFRPR